VRRAAAGALAALVAATVVGVVLGSDGQGAPVARDAPVARALEAVVVRALALEQNLGAPAPPGVADPAWALRGVASVGPAGSPHLARPGRPWVRPDGTVAFLGAAQAASILAAQTRELRALSAGGLRSELLGELRSIVSGERHSTATLSSPGGARPVRWFSVTVDGARATVDGYVDTWDERTTVRRSRAGAGTWVASSHVEVAEVEALATLERSGGVWRVDSLAQKPYQQAT